MEWENAKKLQDRTYQIPNELQPHFDDGLPVIYDNNPFNIFGAYDEAIANGTLE